MYKKQMTIQKAVCLFVLCTSVIVFIYSLGIMTDLFDSLYYTITDAANRENTRRNSVAGAFLYYDMQDFNKQFLHLGIGLILMSLLLFITNTHVRRRYYIGNIIAVAANVIANIYVAIWAHTRIVAYRAEYLNVDFEALKTFSERRHTYYTDSTFWFDVHTFVFGLAILACILLVANMIWKFSLMKQEQHLVDAGKGVAA
ncbi:MAG: hypothetical protein IJ242_00870 [Clostridia bacterium]|nr:hypothetical protein [Clostridia bacterium]